MFFTDTLVLHSIYLFMLLLDPFGGDPFKESDPFRSSAPEDFFKKQVKSDPFTSDPFTKPPTLPSKVSNFKFYT